jgi:hypothetical protein
MKLLRIAWKYTRRKGGHRCRAIDHHRPFPCRYPQYLTLLLHLENAHACPIGDLHPISLIFSPPFQTTTTRPLDPSFLNLPAHPLYNLLPVKWKNHHLLFRRPWLRPPLLIISHKYHTRSQHSHLFQNGIFLLHHLSNPPYHKRDRPACLLPRLSRLYSQRIIIF